MPPPESPTDRAQRQPAPPASSHNGQRAGLAVAAVVAIAATMALGIILRLVDPLSTSVIPAEDPYTHMALVREHLRTGSLEPLAAHETLYPPGLHGFLAATLAFTGVDLYDLTRFGPVLFGAIGILGMALLLWRTVGPVAAVVGSLGLALAPEAIFRTTMMSPTALDLAILPFFLDAVLRILSGRLGWVGVAAPMALFLAVAHPWLLAILSAAGVLFLLLAFVLPWPSRRGPPLSVPGAAWSIAVLGCGLGLALTMPTFGFVLPVPDGVALPRIGLAVAVLAVSPLVALSVARRRGWTRRSESAVAPTQPLALRFALSLTLAAVLAGTWVFAVRQGLPEFVDLSRMLGWPIVLLAFAALVALPFVASPLANLAGALTAILAPFVLFNPLDSEFLPHRTAIFLGVALCMLAGVAAHQGARAVTRLVYAAQSRRRKAPAGPGPRAARPLVWTTLPTLLVATLAAGTVYAGTPDGYDGGWYRLYNGCELEALQDVANQVNDNPRALVITGDWQAKLVLAALVDNPSQVGYISEVFTHDTRRDGLVAQMAREERPLVLVLERHLRAETPDADTTFLADAPWRPAGAWCANMGLPQPRVTAYTTEALQ